MLLGDFERAWQETDRIESRRRQGTYVEGQLVWDGTDFDDKTVLLRCDQGLGDAIQFIRYARFLRVRCSRLIVKVKPILLPLLQTIPFIDKVISKAAPDPAYDVDIECMELPYAFRTTLNSIPNSVPYIHIQAGDTLGHHDFNVGLSWASEPWNKRRSITLADLHPLKDLANVSFHSLQWGPASADVLNREHGLPIRNAAAPINEDLVETARAISRLDLVITVDTMVAHLAGALGKPVWVLLDFDCDWRWMLEREDSPWYPTMRLFRQPQPGNWATPIYRIKEILSTSLWRLYEQSLPSGASVETDPMHGKARESGRGHQAVEQRHIRHDRLGNAG